MIELYQRNTEVAVPVLVSSAGYGIVWGNASHTRVYLKHDVVSFWSEAGTCISYYFIHGPGFDAVVGGIRRLTGKCQMMPKYIFGYVQSKERYKTGTELVSVVKEFQDRKIPLDVIVQDWQYWGSILFWGQKSFNPKQFPDPAATFAEIHSRGVKVLISSWPIFSILTPDYKEFKKKRDGLFLKPGLPINAYDPYTAENRELYWRQLVDGVLVHGPDGLWCDSPEPTNVEWVWKVPNSRAELDAMNLKFIKRAYHSAVVNTDVLFLTYPLVHAQGIYEHWRKTYKTRLVNLTRSGFTGQQRYSNFVWSGDISARWDVLAAQIRAGVNFCLTGHPYWTMDIGGFYTRSFSPIFMARGGFPKGVKDLGYRELYTRWFQMGAFTPMFRSHGTGTPREPWQFGEPGSMFYDTILGYIHLRYRLLPYIYSIAWKVVHEDATMMRHLAFDFNDDAKVHGIDDQYLFGPGFMVCPVTMPMYYRKDSVAIDDVPRTRKVYLPSHEGGWYDFWSGKHHDGGMDIAAPCPIDTIPLFVPAGSIIPMGPPKHRATEIPEDPIELHVYAGRDGQFEIYEDENDTYNYENGVYSIIPITWKEATRMLVIGDRQGRFPGMLESRRFIPVIHDPARPRGHALSADGKVDLTAPGLAYSGREITCTID